MTDPQSNRLDMFNLVSAFYTAHQAIIDAIPARTAAFTTHNTNRAAILAAVGAQSSATTGSTLDKAQARELLNLITDTVFAPVRAWATVNNDNTTLAQFEFSPTQISQIKDDTIQAFLELRITIVNTNIVALADYGITPALITQWEDALTNYLTFLTAPRGAIVQRSVQTSNLRTLFKQTSGHLKTVVDPLMVTLRASHPDLFNEYTRARIIIDRRGPGTPGTPTPPSVPTIKISGIITHAVLLTPVTGATVVITVGTLTYTATTGAAGIYTKDVPSPTVATPASITASAPGLMLQNRAITLQPTQNQTQDFALQPTPPPPPTP